jgi:hypothetical protein
VYVNGSGFSPSTTYNLYIVVDSRWIDGIAIPKRISDTAENVSSDSSGNIPPTSVWSPLLTMGKYDIIIDVNSNDHYDEGIDALDDKDIEVTAGFFIPDFSSQIIVLLFMITTILAVLVLKGKDKA